MDATPDVIEKANNYYREIARRNWEHNNEKRAKTPDKGKMGRVYKGRKVPVGTTGEIIWYGHGKSYGYRNNTMRVGIKDATDKVHWTDVDNVEVVNWEQYLYPEDQFYYTPHFCVRAA